MSGWAWFWIYIGAVVALWLLVVGVLILLGRRARAREMAAFVPDCLVLFKRLLGDPRVPRRAKVALVVLAGYIALPLDLVPDFIPVIGFIDDALFIVLGISYVVRATGREAVEELWPGSDAGLKLILAGAAA
jgi:uncharacterized membrane protein YkvA (DUF1232 family)